MKKLKKYWLNEHGERYWYFNSDITITAYRSYHWVDRITYINEGGVACYENGLTTTNRRCIPQREFDHPGTYTEFKYELENWTPISDYENYMIMLKSHYICEERKNKLKKLTKNKKWIVHLMNTWRVLKNN